VRIVIDLQGAQSNSRFRGIGRYSLSITKGIIRSSDSSNEIFVLLNGILYDTIDHIRNELDGLIPQSHIKVWFGYGPTNIMSDNSEFNRESAKILREAYIYSLSPDIVLITSMIEGYDDNSILSVNRFFDTPTASIFYDAIPLLQADKYLIDGSPYKEFYLDKIDEFKHCKMLLGISQSACNEAIDALKFNQKDLSNINAAVDKIFKPIEISSTKREKLYKKFHIDKKFILITGATDERKNHLRLIEAFSLLEKEIRDNYQLVIAGGIPYRIRWDFMKHAKSLKIKKSQLIFTDWVEDDELVALYNLCELFVYPSWHEGFGLPVLEAMCCGTAVIGANTTSIPEVIGNTDALFDPFDSKSISDKIAEYLKDEKKRLSLGSYLMERSKIFSWDISGRLVLDAIESRRDIFKHNTNNNISRDKIVESIITHISNIKSDNIENRSLLNISKAISLNHPKDDKKQILVDISELVHHDAKSGIQRVVRNILKEMISAPPKDYEIKAVYASKDRLGYRYANIFMGRFMGYDTANSIDEPIDISSQDIFLGLDMSPEVQIFQADTYREFRNIGMKVSFVIYDLLTQSHPEWFVADKDTQKIVVENFEKWLEVVTDSNQTISISQYTANELSKWIRDSKKSKNSSHSIDYFHMGADIEGDISTKKLPQEQIDILEKLKSKITFLIVGTLEARKGQMQTLLAFEELWSNDIDTILVLVGKQGWLTEELIKKIENHPELNRRLFWLNGINDNFLEELYSACSCLISPSEGEGFGLPLIEAAQHNMPIIARDIPVFREVAKDYAFYFKDSKEPQVIANSIKEWIELHKNDNHPKSDNMPWLTWRESSNNLLSLLLKDIDKK